MAPAPQQTSVVERPIVLYALTELGSGSGNGPDDIGQLLILFEAGRSVDDVRRLLLDTAFEADADQDVVQQHSHIEQQLDDYVRMLLDQGLIAPVV